MLVVVLSLLVCWCAAEGLDNPADPWRTWLLIEDQVPSGDLLLRRITPKSVFIAPPIHKCPEGYRTDAMGRCVKIVKVDQAAQWEFFLNKLNSMFAFPASEPSSSLSSSVNSVPSSNEEDRGPFQVSIPFAKQNSSATKDTTVSPPPTESPVSSSTVSVTPPTSAASSISSQSSTGQTVPSSTHTSQSVQPQDHTDQVTPDSYSSTSTSDFSNLQYPVTTESSSSSSNNNHSSEENVNPTVEATTTSSTISSISSSNSYSTMSVSSSTSNSYNRAPTIAGSNSYGSAPITSSGSNFQSSIPYSSGSSHSYSSVPMNGGNTHSYGPIPNSGGSSYYSSGPFSSSNNHYNSAPIVSSSSNYNSAPIINTGSSYITAPINNGGSGYNTAPNIGSSSISYNSAPVSSSSSYNSAPVSSSGHRYHSAPISSGSGGYNTASMYYATAGENKHNFSNVDVDTSVVASAPSSLGNTESNIELIKKPFLIVVPNSSDYVDSTVASTTQELPTTITETYPTSSDDIVTSTNSINSTPLFFDEDKQNLSRIDEVSSSVGITEANVEVVKKPFLIVVPNSADYYVETTTQDVPTTETYTPSDPTTVTTPTESTDWTTTVMTDSLTGFTYRYT